MMQVWKYDENKIFIESCFVEELEENMTTVPLTIGYIKPTFDKDKQEWCEGATDEEKQKWEEENQQVDKTKISLTPEQKAIEELSMELAKLKLKLN